MSGDRCFVFGHNNEISASDVFAFGNGLTTNPNDYAPHIIIGNGNVPSESTNKYVITVGISTSSENKRNIFTLDWDGNIVCRSVTQATAALLSDDTEESTPTYSAQSENVVEFGGVTYTFTVAETGEYTGVTTSTGKSMKANIPAGLGNTQTHNKLLTLSAHLSDGTVLAASGVCPQAPEIGRPLFITITLPDGNDVRMYRGSTVDSFSLLCQVRVYSGKSVSDLRTLKLELGGIATPLCPPDPAVELAKCQRYYQIRSTGDIPAVDLRPSMATIKDIKLREDGNYEYIAEL